MEANYNLKSSDFLTFDAMWQTAQCLGRVIWNKRDYGLMILADKWYQRSDKMEKLPLWIQKWIYSAYTSVDMAE